MHLFKRLARPKSTMSYAGPAGGSLVVDVETTGLSPDQGHRVTWLGAAIAVDTASAPQPVMSVAVHGTNGLAVFGDAPPAVPRHDRRDVVEWMDAASQAASVVVAHNAAFDAKFILAEFAACNRVLPSTPWLCTMQLARRLFPQWPNHKLTTCLQQAGITPPAEHDAAAEALATAHLWQYLLVSAGEQGVSDWADIVDIAGVAPGENTGHPGGVGRGGHVSVTIGLEDVYDLGSLDSEADLTVEDLRRAQYVCEGRKLADITDPAHRAAHEQEQRADEEDRDALTAAYQALSDAGCPQALRYWRHLTWQWGKGNKGELDGAVFVLGKFRDMGVTDVDEIRGVIITATSAAYELKNGPAMLLTADRDLHEWLTSFGSCAMCARSGRVCDCLDLGSQAGELLRLRLHPDDLAVMATSFWTSDPQPLNSPKQVVEPLMVIRDLYPAANADLLTHVALATEKAGDVPAARALFELAITSGYAPDTAYERVSLMAERAKEFSVAAELAEEGIRRTNSTTMATKLTKRAQRCRVKA